MPDAKGKFLGIFVGDVPWQVEFLPGTPVRSVHTGREGRVLEHLADWNLYEVTWAGGSVSPHQPGELRAL